MNRDTYWKIIEDANASGAENLDEEIRNKLEGMKDDKEVLSFLVHTMTFQHRAYDAGLYDVAVNIFRGCGDDNFFDFRSNLIALGRKRYFEALENPDTLSTLTDGEIDFLLIEGFFSFLDDLVDVKAEDLPKRPEDMIGLRCKDEEEFRVQYPKIHKRFSKARKIVEDLFERAEKIIEKVSSKKAAVKVDENDRDEFGPAEWAKMEEAMKKRFGPPKGT